jgi:CO/xanthine dehydrogenase Mo-binding subunit
VFEKHKLTCWSASQGPHALRRQLAEMMGMPQTDVRVIYVEGAGCYGRNGHEDAAADAALLARATRRPVRVQWMRQDEHGWDPKGPPTLIDLEGGLTAADDVVAWRSAFFTPDGSAGNVPLIAASLAGMPHETTMSPGKILGDSAIPYSFPNIRTVAHRLADTPLRPSWIRTPGRMQNTFANECFIDELAAAVNADPLVFGLRHITILAAPSSCTGSRGRPSGSRGPRRSANTAVRRAATSSPGAALPMSNTSWCAPMWAQWRRSRSTAAAARSARRASSSHRIAARSSIPTACATRSKAMFCRR